MFRIGLLFLSIFLSITALGCVTGDDGRPSQLEQDQSETETNFEDEEGGVVTRKGGELPEDFPEDVPIFSPADIASSASAENVADDTSLAFFATERGLADVSGFYEAQLPEAGWLMTGNDKDTTDQVTLTATKEGKSLSVSISWEPKRQRCLFSLGITKPKPPAPPAPAP